mmetsp:Transcript_43670/g.120893  ORF Transcript_43670/g.120893 Transcript_43670/m.120893 type:complete len:164 (-) Transcript_43670:22-513(-)
MTDRSSRNGYSIHQRMQNRFEVDQRAALLGRYGGAASKDTGASTSATKEMIERQNDEQIGDLHDKVSRLKDITRGIGKQARDSNTLLDGMSLDMDKASNLLRGTLNHLKVMVQQGNGKHMCYMVLFVFALFFMMYLLNKTVGKLGQGSGSTPTLEILQNATSY